ncbi:MAG: hypothetical protein GX614_01345, partial [Sandaracinaceae bacterium]|nr:hypothetical protein [Sandaracinaceae bacterium]
DDGGGNDDGGGGDDDDEPGNPACDECVSVCHDVTQICDDVCDEVPANASGCPAFCSGLGVCEIVCEDAAMLCPYLCDPSDWICSLGCQLIASSACRQLCTSQCASTICGFAVNICDRDPCRSVQTICETQCPCE